MLQKKMKLDKQSIFYMAIHVVIWREHACIHAEMHTCIHTFHTCRSCERKEFMCLGRRRAELARWAGTSMGRVFRSE